MTNRSVTTGKPRRPEARDRGRGDGGGEGEADLAAVRAELAKAKEELAALAASEAEARGAEQRGDSGALVAPLCGRGAARV